MDFINEAPSTSKEFRPTTFGVSLACGAFAGLAVDLSLYPLDTLKTRLQSEIGFKKSGGFSRIYAGVPSIAVGSAPAAALFFATYESSKYFFNNTKLQDTPASHMIAASISEVVACFIRVPTEVVKQRSQASPNTTLRAIIATLMHREGPIGFYRGFVSTLIREIPFSLIEFPLWEGFKIIWKDFARKDILKPWQSATCGAVAGSLAACITTPLDVAKTRIMLAEKLYMHDERLKIRNVIADIYKTQGIHGLYSGVMPRTAWMGLGGFIFFGAYELLLSSFNRKIERSESHKIIQPINVNVNFERVHYKLRNWLDKMYAYFTTHDGKTISEIASEKSFEDRLIDDFHKNVQKHREVFKSTSYEN